VVDDPGLVPVLILPSRCYVPMVLASTSGSGEGVLAQTWCAGVFR
jgi:hypothetical protein